ncbi:MAG: hypothetical protein Q4C96_07725 [Planctomycetia bacterium]|nr:hypothetical protein [Planctomycetia bacterium]
MKNGIWYIFWMIISLFLIICFPYAPGWEKVWLDAGVTKGNLFMMILCWLLWWLGPWLGIFASVVGIHLSLDCDERHPVRMVSMVVVAVILAAWHGGHLYFGP